MPSRLYLLARAEAHKMPQHDPLLCRRLPSKRMCTRTISIVWKMRALPSRLPVSRWSRSTAMSRGNSLSRIWNHHLEHVLSSWKNVQRAIGFPLLVRHVQLHRTSQFLYQSHCDANLRRLKCSTRQFDLSIPSIS